jgi:hypothetical protein
VGIEEVPQMAIVRSREAKPQETTCIIGP